MLISLLALISFSGCASQQAENVDPLQSGPPEETSLAVTEQPVLVELFTSEGCSSCPPADKALTFLDTQQPVTNAEVITLAFHVDYWDRLGWKDAFSSPQFSERQETYTRAMKLDSNYTPQMVVDGAQQFVGSNTGIATDAITKASASKKGKVDLNLSESVIKIDITGIPKHEAATVYLAAAEDNISTKVRAGENSGKTLAHTSIVRKFDEVGMLSPSETSYKASVEVPTDLSWKKQNLKYVVFVQENASRKILAVGRAKARG